MVTLKRFPLVGREVVVENAEGKRLWYSGGGYAIGMARMCLDEASRMKCYEEMRDIYNGSNVGNLAVGSWVELTINGPDSWEFRSYLKDGDKQ